MIRHKPHCRVFDVAGVHDDANCSCGATRREQRKSAFPPQEVIHRFEAVLRDELKNLRAICVEAAVSLSLDEEAIRGCAKRIRLATDQLEGFLFDRPELPLAGRSSS